MKSIIKIEPFGEFEYRNSERIWICFAKNVYSKNELELSFEVENQNQNLDNKIELMENFVNEISLVESYIYDFVQKRVSEKTIDEIKSIWFLSAIELKNDNENWWVTFEPNFDCETIYNHFLRFTFNNNKIIWSNLENEV
jgi:hypothetical protein